MKKNDIAMIVLIASVSILVGYFVTKNVLGGVYTGKATVKVIEKISPDIAVPDPEIFNKDAINPAVQVQIDGGK